MSTKPAKQLTGCVALALALIAQPAAAMYGAHAHRHVRPVWYWQGANAAVSQPSNLSRFAYGAGSAPAGR
jgi:hypothetical protein